jgi:hypothetical protein
LSFELVIFYLSFHVSVNCCNNCHYYNAMWSCSTLLVNKKYALKYNACEREEDWYACEHVSKNLFYISPYGRQRKIRLI